MTDMKEGPRVIDTAKLQQCLQLHFPGDIETLATTRNIAEQLCRTHIECGLADSNFKKRLYSRDRCQFWQTLSEALLAHQLLEASVALKPARDHGPDFLKNGYIKDGIVGPQDSYVIAINARLLRKRTGLACLNGISGLPLAVEVAFALGPQQITFNLDTSESLAIGHQHRVWVVNHNKSPVQTNAFLDQTFKPVSAIWAILTSIPFSAQTSQWLWFTTPTRQIGSREGSYQPSGISWFHCLKKMRMTSIGGRDD